MSNSLTVLSKSRLLQSISVLAVASVASIGGAHAQAANVTPSNVNVLNLLSPFLGLNATPVGRTTLTDNLSQAISINNSATLPLQELSYSDKNLLGSASNTVTGISGSFGVAANLAGGLPDQPPATGGTVPGIQPVGGYGATLGAIYDQGVNAYAAGNHSRAAEHGEPALDRLQHFHQLRPGRGEILLRQRHHERNHHGCRAGRLHLADVQRPAQHDEQCL